MCYKNPKILIIEDSPEKLEQVSVILIKAGYQIEIAINGLYAITMLLSTAYDLVLMDLSNPQINGKDFISKIRISPLNIDLPVIFIIPPDLKKEFMKDMDIGGYDFAGNPINEKEILYRVNNQLELKNAKQVQRKSESHISSLNYAQMIQASLLPSIKQLEDIFP